MNLAHILKAPIITEKTLEAVKKNRYTFRVDKLATKYQIMAAVNHYFDVDVVSVATSITPGHAKRTGRRRLPTTTVDTKKAIVEIKPGQKIAVFEVKG
jgi:large subunit ribosomal protein L23